MNTKIPESQSASALVDIELAKDRFNEAVAEIHSYPNINSDMYVSKAATKTIMEFLITAGICSRKQFYNKFTDKLLEQSDAIADLLGVEVPVDDNEEEV